MKKMKKGLQIGNDCGIIKTDYEGGSFCRPHSLVYFLGAQYG